MVKNKTTSGPGPKVPTEFRTECPRGDRSEFGVRLGIEMTPGSRLETLGGSQFKTSTEVHGEFILKVQPSLFEVGKIRT